QEVGVRIERFGSQSIRDSKFAAVDLRARWRRHQCAHMANCTPDLVKQLRPSLTDRRLRLVRVPSWSLGSANEAGKVVEIVQPVGVGWIIRLRSRIAQLRHLVRKKPRRNSHLIKI